MATLVYDDSPECCYAIWNYDLETECHPPAQFWCDKRVNPDTVNFVCCSHRLQGNFTPPGIHQDRPWNYDTAELRDRLHPTTADTPAAWTCPLLSGQGRGFAHWMTGSSQPLLEAANVTGRAHHPEYIVEVSRTSNNLQPAAHRRADWCWCFRWVCQPLN